MRIALMIRAARTTTRVWVAALTLLVASSPAGSTAAERRGGIEIGSKGVKATAVELEDTPGGPAVKTILANVSNTTVSSGVVKTRKYAADAIQETAVEAGKFARKMIDELGIPAEKIRVIGSSGLPAAPNREELVAAVAKATGLPAMEFLTPGREVELTIAGLVPEPERPRALLVDVGSGNTKGGFIGAGGNVSVFSVPFGSVTFADRVTKDAAGGSFPATAERLRSTILEAPIVEQVRANPALTSRPVVYLSGGAVYAMSTLLHPESISQRRVSLSAGDIAGYLKLVGDGQKVPTPSLDSISKPEVRALAEQEVRNVLDTFTPENLLAGAELLAALSTVLQFEGKTLVFDRSGATAWIRATLTPPPPPTPVVPPTQASAPASTNAREPAATIERNASKPPAIRPRSRRTSIIEPGPSRPRRPSGNRRSLGPLINPPSGFISPIPGRSGRPGTRNIRLGSSAGACLGPPTAAKTRRCPTSRHG